MGCYKNTNEKKVYSYTGLPQVAGKVPNKESEFIRKETRRSGKTKTQQK